MANAPLRKCPTCLTPVADVNLGLRDFRWASDALPGKVAPMDLDHILERNGRFLVWEFKPKDMRVGMGQLITLKALEALGMDVFIVYGEDDDIKVTDLRGVRLANVETKADLAQFEADWFEEASRAGRP